MASWFYASEGKQQGPFPEGQFRDLIAQGVVRPDTLVWTEGMAGWQKAAEIPGLVGGGAPPMIPAGGPPTMGGRGNGGAAGGSLSVDFGILEFTWRSIVMLIGMCFVIPAPWVFVWYTKWIVPCVKVPGRPNLSFTGNAMALVPWFFGFIVLAIAIGFIGSQLLSNLLFLVQIVLYWLLIKMDRREPRLQWAAARHQLHRLGLGLCRLESAVRDLDHYHRRLGLGCRGSDALVLPQH
ncbi:hypothetical protein AB7M38_006307 [Bradyrhizobium diazoefficiens]